MKLIYAVRDNVASANVGGVYLFPHDTPAVRFFSDVALDPQTMVGRHPKDHSLLQLGTLDEDTCVVVGLDQPRVVLSGEAWLAMHQAAAQSNNEG